MEHGHAGGNLMLHSPQSDATVSVCHVPRGRSTVLSAYVRGLSDTQLTRFILFSGILSGGISATDCGAEIEMTISETDFAYRLDRWDTFGGNIIHHIANIDDLELAMAAYEAACKRWPGEAITLRQGARIIKATRV